MLLLSSLPDPSSSSTVNANFSKKPSQRAAQTALDAMAPNLLTSTLSRPRAPLIGSVNLPSHGRAVVVAAVEVAIDFVAQALLSLSNWQALFALHSLEDSLKHGSGFSVVVVVVLVVVGTEHTEEAASNAHPVAKQFFFLRPVHGLKSAHCFTPSTAPKTQPSTALHFFRFSPSQTLPLPSALLHVLVGLSNTHPSVFLHLFPLRPLHI